LVGKVLVGADQLQQLDQYNDLLLLRQRLVDLLTDSQGLYGIFYRGQLLLSVLVICFTTVARELIVEVQVLFYRILVEFSLEEVYNVLPLAFSSAAILFCDNRKKLGESFEYFFTHG
jgi:hypothetical protein